jgi:aspartyl-tRNA(Asn)/glutamyl-tRNA(Gln) amidotransferase subunit A
VTPTDLTACTATELLLLYRSKQASPVEATQAVLARIERLNPSLRAFCHVAGDEALASARASEARWQRGEAAGALDGVPTSIKDLILTRGMPTLRGSHTVDPAQPWEVDARASAIAASAREGTPGGAPTSLPRTGSIGLRSEPPGSMRVERYPQSPWPMAAIATPSNCAGETSRCPRVRKTGGSRGAACTTWIVWNR